jgi:DNA-binding transcriptional MerR regulator
MMKFSRDLDLTTSEGREHRQQRLFEAAERLRQQQLECMAQDTGLSVEELKQMLEPQKQRRFLSF